jgi:hypothetical protein
VRLGAGVDLNDQSDKEKYSLEAKQAKKNN